ncbi:taurine catabolism dioxygenase [Laetiporus sulphureus 93-53]|uniref:Taurine catabolism dioxygenase n=1 Tax=Laetiporus sulphureus 93-53 TaxID=1314785 RepID=A0A165IJM4_9APHY|nr:taurine catabolism dioxygenase [Laetiporus sulphureus 93-53]KZT13170.1 taurine catabolism dioxygenase [Laetiporus sulphureus 93-53]
MSSTQTTTLAESQTPGSLSVRTSTVPLIPTGALDKYEYVDLTSVLGREYPNVQLSDLLNAENADELIRELAIIVSQRNVAFFRNQDITVEQQKLLGNKLGILSGRPKESGLHIHPTTQPSPELGLEISVITSLKDKKKEWENELDISQFASREWHSDITFEPVPSDFAILKIHTLPENGGDTVWASGYEAYDRLSPPFAKYLEGLSALHDAKKFKIYVEATGNTFQEGPRGNPENVGDTLQAIHPVIRTNPVTGWKAVFVNKNFTKRILGITKDESDITLDYLHRLITENHDLQVRFKWRKNDVAIWANSASLHNVTRDYDAHREGNRVVSIGERPYFDSSSKSRREALGLKKRIEF